MAPEIQQYLLAMPETLGRPTVSERVLRPDNPAQQLTAFQQVLTQRLMRSGYRHRTS